MQIFINNKVAALKKGSSFEFIAENRYFSGADSYTLAITFPIKDCPQNIAIFGHINRKDVQTKNLLFDCVIRDRNMERYGAITVTEIDDTEVKCQFLEGQSVQNYDVAFDEIYINDLELGYPADASNIAWAKVNFPAENLRNSLADGQNWQALPWVNNYSGNLQNGLIQHGDSTWHWQTSSPNLSFQPYLVYIIERIFEVLGYTCDTSSIRVSRFANLLICNTLPSAWNIYNFAKALPHWTLTEFLEQLELLFGGFFEIDKTQKTVSFTFTRSESAVRGSVHLHRVVDNYTCKHQNTVSRSAKGYAVRYADCDHRMWKYYSCQPFIERLENGSFRCREENSIDGAISFMNIDNTYPQYYNPGFDFRVGTEPPYKYYMERTRKVVNAPNNQYMITYGMQRLNLCGMPETEGDTKELKLVPVWLDELSPESGYVIFLQCPELEYEGRYSNDINMSDAEYVLSLGDKQKQTEFFDKIYIGYWDGGQIYGAELHPYIDTIDFISGSTYLTRPHTLDITTINEDKYMNDITLDKSVKYTFKFLADSIPNPRDMFYILGRRYVCEKITATFTEEGMSQLLKGDFYPVED